MRRFSFNVAAAITFITAATVGMAGTAAAAPTGGGNAADTINELRTEGYNVQINGSVSVPLSECVTTGVHGVSDTSDAASPHSGTVGFTTVDVDVSCPVYD